MIKRISYITIGILLSLITVKSAEASLVIDPSKIVAKVQELTQKIVDVSNQVTKRIDQVTQIEAEGFNFDSIYKQGTALLPKGTFNWFTLANQTEGTKQDRVEELARDKQNYQEGAENMYEDKLDGLGFQLGELNKGLGETMSKIGQKTEECALIKASFDAAVDKDERTRLQNEYIICEMELEKLNRDKGEYRGYIMNMEAKIGEMERTIAAVPHDVNMKAYRAHEKIVQNEEEEESISDDLKNKDGEWDDENLMEDYEITEDDYQKFIKRYFNDPSDPSNEGSSGQNFQSRQEKIMRERKFLFINAASHLLQTSISLRREIPDSEKNLKQLFEQTLKENDINSTSLANMNMRIENTKALLLYARMLSAKLQYLAAHDLLKAYISKEMSDENGNTKSYKNFDLGKYIVTPDYVSYLVKKANETTPNWEDTPAGKLFK